METRHGDQAWERTQRANLFFYTFSVNSQFQGVRTTENLKMQGNLL